MSIQYWKAVVGNAMCQMWFVAIYVHTYLVYRLITKWELWLIIYFILLGIVQGFTTKLPLLIQLVQWFKPMKMFDRAEIIELEPTKKTNSLFCFHPHGIYGYGMLLNLYTKNTFFENLVVVGSRVALLIPMAGMFLKQYGIQGVNASNFERLLSEGQNVGLVPGGFEEATLTSKKENRLFIKSRKGFIKYALRYGVTIYPVFTFGENQLFNTFDKFMTLRLWLNKFKFVGTFFWSRFLTFPEPHTELITVSGKGIQCPKIENPTKQEIDNYHALYIQALKELYDSQSPLYAPKMPLVLY